MVHLYNNAIQSMSSVSGALSVLLFGEFLGFIPFFMFLSCIPIMVIVYQVKSLFVHQAFASMSLLGALTFVLEQHISKS